MNTEGCINIALFKTITKAISQSENLEDMSNHLAQLLTASLNIKGCAIFILEPATRELDVLASFGLSTDYLMKGPVSAPQSIAATFDGKTVVIKDVADDASLQYPEEAKKEGIAAIISVPITFSEEVIGALRLYHQEIWDITEEDLESLRLLAEMIGLAMSYTKLRYAMNTVAETLFNTFSEKQLNDLKSGRMP